MSQPMRAQHCRSWTNERPVYDHTSRQGSFAHKVFSRFGQTGGGVDREVSILGQSHQGDVVTGASGGVVVRMDNDQVNVEILRDQRLVLGV